MAGSRLPSPLRAALLSTALVALLGACSPDRDHRDAMPQAATPAAGDDAAEATVPAADPSSDAARTCNADGLQDLVGQEATETLIAKATADSGATSVRVLGPDDVATMDFRNDRLTITTDSRHIIQTINCG